ncbi:MAG: LysR family transcriptional regulator [Stenotrophomonas acidaminiphila]|jgi:DNA-binding transcriptional LysR family regulator|uniref:LysR substrate-binding domain-containing protein n=1 Tax=Stenotrophomonas acidaminiphila TaxID=128780 RepID=UPI000AC5FB89|nr:LysR substrate-binding domain-containing protein [Stenotrophomonas acidaminiphila]MBN8801657.1 LysR family transcriptional regulator [Stenotrophomonas acidaminiphila]
MKQDFTIDPSLLPALAAFACVARHASFSRAAIELGMSASAASQSVRTLERRLGVRLLHRTTRRVGLTEPGERLLREAAPALARIGGALQALEESRDVPAGRLRITAPRIVVEQMLLPHLPAFSARFPHVEVELAVQAALTDLVAEGFDAGIRLGESLADGMVAVPLGPPQRLVVVAAPDYLRRHRPPETPQALAAHACIRYRRSDGRLMPWEFTRDGHDFSIEVGGGPIFNDSGLGRRMAIAGLGLAQVFEAAAAEDLAAGRLLRLLDAWQPPFPGFHLYYPSREQLAPKLRVFVDFMRDANAVSS